MVQSGHYYTTVVSPRRRKRLVELSDLTSDDISYVTISRPTLIIPSGGKMRCGPKESFDISTCVGGLTFYTGGPMAPPPVASYDDDSDDNDNDDSIGYTWFCHHIQNVAPYLENARFWVAGESEFVDEFRITHGILKRQRLHHAPYGTQNGVSLTPQQLFARELGRICQPLEQPVTAIRMDDSDYDRYYRYGDRETEEKYSYHDDFTLQAPRRKNGREAEVS